MGFRFTLPPTLTLPRRGGGDFVCLLLVVFVFLLALPAHAGQVLNDSFVAKPLSHHLWQEVLSQHVTTEGEVDFTGLRAHPRRLNQYLDQLARFSPDSHPDYFPSYHAKLAYWLNAHNAIALRLILAGSNSWAVSKPALLLGRKKLFFMGNPGQACPRILFASAGIFCLKCYE